MSNEPYGIDIEHANKRAIELVPEEFFWDCTDELAPFGSDEGDTSLAEYRDWRKENVETPTIECLQWVIESVGEMQFADYNESLLSRQRIQNEIEDKNFDDRQYHFTLDMSVIATGFAQLVDEGVIEAANKPLMQIAIDRQIISSELQKKDWEYADEYISKLNVLKRVLAEA
jgi:uncharacterized protein YfeS